MARFDVTLAGHAALPSGSFDDRLLADGLRRLGLSVRLAVWNDPTVDWSAGGVTVLRSTWDYHAEPRRWFDWLDRVSAATSLINAAPLLRWNSEKTYIRDLRSRGVGCIETVFVAPDEVVRLDGITREHGWRDVVVKPAMGASARGAARFREAAHEVVGQYHLEALQRAGVVLVQPFLPAVETTRERSLVLIGGRCVSAFTKPAFNTSLLAARDIEPHNPQPHELELALAAVAAAPWPVDYARVDMVPVDGEALLMELELIEPDLGLRISSAALSAFVRMCADAVSSRAG